MISASELFGQSDLMTLSLNWHQYPIEPRCWPVRFVVSSGGGVREPAILHTTGGSWLVCLPHFCLREVLRARCGGKVVLVFFCFDAAINRNQYTRRYVPMVRSFFRIVRINRSISVWRGGEGGGAGNIAPALIDLLRERPTRKCGYRKNSEFILLSPTTIS